MDSFVDGLVRIQYLAFGSPTDVDSSYALGLLAPFENIRSSLDDAPDNLDLTLPDTIVYWSRYPLSMKPFPVRMNVLLH